MAIFTHTDDDGDRLEVRESLTLPGSSLFHVESNGVRQSVRLDRDAALRLYAALGEWLYPVHTSEYANRSLIEQMIERAVKDQVAAVLPLHLAPVAICRAGECGGVRHLAEPVCTVPDHAEDDPEPHDVGHAEDSACRCHDSDGNSTLPRAPKYVDASPAPGLLGATLAGRPTWDDLVFATHNEAPGGFDGTAPCGCLYGTALGYGECAWCTHSHRTRESCTDRVRQVPGE